MNEKSFFGFMITPNFLWVWMIFDIGNFIQNDIVTEIIILIWYRLWHEKLYKWVPIMYNTFLSPSKSQNLTFIGSDNFHLIAFSNIKRKFWIFFSLKKFGTF